MEQPKAKRKNSGNNDFENFFMVIPSFPVLSASLVKSSVF
jgi:hypothetical protein